MVYMVLLGRVLLATALFSLFSPLGLAQPLGGNVVAVETQDAAGLRVVLSGVLWVPSEPVKGAVLLMHGSGGWSDYREGHYGRAISAAGYAVLAIDSFGARGIVQTTQDQSQVSTLQMTRDAFAARRFLIGKGFSVNRIAIMGFSKGGAVALYAADRNFLPAQTTRFPVAIAFYPACNIRPRLPKPASVVFMALAAQDDYTDTSVCRAIANDFRDAGGQVSVKVYPGAGHAFDGDPAKVARVGLPLVENYRDCVIYLEEDGRQSYAGKTYASDDASILTDLRKTCMKKGATIWTDLQQKKAATRDAIDFLDAALSR